MLLCARRNRKRSHANARKLGHGVAKPMCSLFAFKLHDDVRKNSELLAHDILMSNSNEIVNVNNDIVMSGPHFRITLKIKMPNQKKLRTFKEEGPIKFGLTFKRGEDVAGCFLSGNAALK